MHYMISEWCNESDLEWIGEKNYWKMAIYICCADWSFINIEQQDYKIL